MGNVNRNEEYILEVKNIHKSYGGVKALDNFSLSVKKGECIAIVGDNGAGKSTLIHIISGVIPKDSGEIFYNGKKVEINNPVDARRLGIETLYQNLAVINIFNIPFNIFIGREITYENLYGKLTNAFDYKKMVNETIILFKKYNINIQDLNKPLFNYSGGQRQAVALSRAAFWGSKLIILDEPTTALGVEEAKNALNLINALNEQGITIIAISHNLQHVFTIVDRICVLRTGKNVGIRNIHETSFDEIVGMITGVKVLEKV